jgi:hypothetical protein
MLSETAEQIPTYLPGGSGKIDFDLVHHMFAFRQQLTFTATSHDSHWKQPEGGYF